MWWNGGFLLRKNIPLAYDLGIIGFNSGMVGFMWLIAGYMYVHILKGELPLATLDVRAIASILLMFCTISLVNHLILFVSSYLQGLDSAVFIKKALFPAFLTELATIPFGVVMALAYNRMGLLAFMFLGRNPPAVQRGAPQPQPDPLRPGGETQADGGAQQRQPADHCLARGGSRRPPALQ